MREEKERGMGARKGRGMREERERGMGARKGGG